MFANAHFRSFSSWLHHRDTEVFEFASGPVEVHLRIDNSCAPRGFVRYEHAGGNTAPGDANYGSIYRIACWDRYL